MTEAALTAKDIAGLTGVTDRSILRRASRESWIFKTATGRGGKQKRFPVSTLPDEIRLLHYNRCQSEPAEKSLPAVPEPGPVCKPVDRKALTQDQINNALAKADLLRIYRGQLSRAGWGQKVQARKRFMAAYHAGAWPQLLETLGAIASWKTVEGWKRQVETCGDPLVLADGRGHSKRGSRSVTEEQGKILLRCALKPNSPLISEAIAEARALMYADGIPNGHSDATYRRWLTEWRSKNYHLWVFTREGEKAWNDKCAFYIERDYSLIQVGDILVADGHKLNFEIVNPFTGKPKRMDLIVWKDMKSNYPCGWEIMPTENTAAISSALRRAILTLGKIPRVAYLDNGKAFGAKFFTSDLSKAGLSGLYERLGIQTIFAWKYHGQSKTVERFFSTFAALERMAPTYVGTSIEKKPPRMKMGERLHRKVYQHLTQGNCVTLEQAHRAIAAWIDNVYAVRPQRGHLAGRTPGDMLQEGRGSGVDPDQLTYLMMAQEIRTIHRNGITFGGAHYYSPELYGRRHPVLIRYDLQDLSRILVYELDGTRICEARPVEQVHPAARILGSHADLERLERQIALKKSQERQAGKVAKALLETEIIPTHRRRMAELGLDGGESSAPERVKRLPAKPMTKAEAERIAREAAALETEIPEAAPEEEIPEVEILEEDGGWTAVQNLPEAEKYERLLELEARGDVLPDWAAPWMKYFETLPGFDAEGWEEIRARLAIMYQNQAAAL